MQRKFIRSEAFGLAYRAFMEEYEALGHMQRAHPTDKSPNYFLPHHGVWKEASSTTKLTIVFNGSIKTTSEQSLNDSLHTGPNLLPLLADMLVR